MNKSRCQHSNNTWIKKANISYPALTVCCKQSPGRQAWAQIPPGFGSAHSQLYQTPVNVKQYISHCIYIDTHTHIYIVGETCSSSTSLFFLLPDWFLWGNRKSSAAVGTPGNTATKSCSSGKSETCRVPPTKTMIGIWSEWFKTLIFLKHLFVEDYF